MSWLISVMASWPGKNCSHQASNSPRMDFLWVNLSLEPFTKKEMLSAKTKIYGKYLLIFTRLIFFCFRSVSSVYQFSVSCLNLNSMFCITLYIFSILFQFCVLCFSSVVCVATPCFVSQFTASCYSSVFCVQVQVLSFSSMFCVAVLCFVPQFCFVFQFVRLHICNHGSVQNHSGGILQNYWNFLYIRFFGNDLTFL